MKRLIIAAIRCSLILLVPAIGYAISAQWTAHSDKTKTGIDRKPAQHSGAHNKRTSGRSGHASTGMHGKHATGGASTRTQHAAMSGQHSGRGKRAANAHSEVTPTPTPTPSALPESGLTGTPTPLPMAGSTATP